MEAATDYKYKLIFVIGSCIPFEHQVKLIYKSIILLKIWRNENETFFIIVYRFKRQ